MAMILKNNMPSVNTLNTLNKNSKSLAKSLEKVSSGMKINSAADDASGYAISERMRVQIRGLDQDIRNAQNGISMLKTAEGAVSSTLDILKTIKEKAINAANDSNTDADRASMQKEVDQRIDQINDNAMVTYNGKYMLNKPGGEAGKDASLYEIENFIIKGLNSEWLARSVELVTASYNYAFGANASINEMDVQFENDSSSSALAYVTNYSSGGVASKLSLTINMAYNGNMSLTDENGETNSANAGYLDRTIAHEMTHALMAANINYFSNLPKYLKEGMAELVHGIDDERQFFVDFAPHNTNPDKNITSASFTDAVMNGSGEGPYKTGYIWLRYLEKQFPGSVSSLASGLDSATNAASELDSIVNTASGGRFTSANAVTAAIVSDLQSYEASNGGNWANSTKQFLQDKCGIIIGNDDTGSITGSDAGGGSTKTAESIVPESTQPSAWTSPDGTTTVIGDLTITWPTDFVGGEKNYQFMLLQVGTKANQSIKVDNFDMRAKALGLISNDGKTIQLTTQKQAEALLTKKHDNPGEKETPGLLDSAINYALDVQTTIGALQSRLEYTVRNLTTASENVQSSESVIRDADMAKEMTNYTKHNVLLQAAQSMLAQANQNSSAVLSLLQ